MHEWYANLVVRTEEDRFWSKVEKRGPDECWLWTGHRLFKGYGSYKGVGGGIKKAHRVVWEMTHGEIPPGMFVCHRCDNPPCVNPNHLWLGSAKDNSDDMVDKGRDKHVRGSRHHGAKLTEETVLKIRELYAKGAKQSELVKQFGLKKYHVSWIVNRHIWKHI